jgi:hypothetical protein
MTTEERAVFVILRTFHADHPQDFTRETLTKTNDVGLLW